jgi:hypothetical protein
MAKDKHLQQRAILRVAVFGIVTVFFVTLSILGLISNSNGAKERYDALIAVDQAGGDVEKSLNELRTYIYAHMNTQIGSELGVKPPIQLKATYERLVALEEEKALRTNEALYQEAQAYCERTQPAGFSGRNRIDCIASYIDTHGVKVEPKIVEDDFYKFDFVPPRWSPDLAGYSILLASVFGTVFFIDIIRYLRTKSTVNM